MKDAAFQMTRAVVLAITMVCAAPALGAQMPVPSLCLQTLRIHLPDGTQAEWRPLGETRTRLLVEGDPVPAGFIKSDAKLVDGLATPVVEVNAFSSTSRTWRITSTLSFEPIPGLDPNIVLSDNVAKDPASGRVLALHHISGLYVFDETSNAFRHLSFREQQLGALYAIRAIPRLGMTLVSTQQGLYRLDGDRLVTVEGAGPSVVGPATQIWDLPIHHGVVLNRAFVGEYPSTLFRSDDGLVRLLARNSQTVRWSSAVFESTLPGRLLLEGSNEIFDVEMSPTKSGWLPKSSDRLWESATFTFPGYFVTKAGVTLVLSRPGRYWGHHGLERLDVSGLHAVAGEAVDAPTRPQPMLEMQGGAVLIKGTDRWYRYLDGSVMTIVGSETRAIGPSSNAVALPSIGKTLIVAGRAVFTVMPDARLERLPVPFEITDHYTMQITDFPAVGRGLISIADHLYEIDPTGSIQVVANLEGQGDGRIYVRGKLPGNNDTLLIAHGGVLQVLRYSKGAGGCDLADPINHPDRLR